MENTVKLKYPIKIKASNGTMVDLETLTFCRPKTKHLKKMPSAMLTGESNKINPVDLLPFIAALSGIDENEAEEIDMADLIKIVEVVSAILGKSLSQETGEKLPTG